MQHSQDTSRDVDQNGFITIPKNPISRVGVFPYSGRNLPDADPDKIYNVYRPESELASPETLKSFEMIPLINDHEMLGEGFSAAEEKGVHGSTGAEAIFENGILYTPLRIFSETLKQLISLGKKELSAGYRCVYEKTSGVFNGQAYDYIQKQIRGNHIALVQQGRMGPDVRVLDAMAFDHFDLVLDEQKKGTDEMADENKDKDKGAESETKKEKDEGATEGAEGEGKKEMTMGEAHAALAAILPMLEKMNTAISSLQAAAKQSDDTQVLDKDDDKEKEKEKESMDAKEIATRLTALEARTGKDALLEIAKRDKLLAKVTPFTGTFDASEMTASGVAKVALEKAGIKAPAGQEEIALDAFLAGRASTNADQGFGLDGGETTEIKADGKLAKRLNTNA